jgi:hypothetical protein
MQLTGRRPRSWPSGARMHNTNLFIAGCAGSQPNTCIASPHLGSTAPPHLLVLPRGNLHVFNLLLQTGRTAWALHLPRLLCPRDDDDPDSTTQPPNQCLSPLIGWPADG